MKTFVHTLIIMAALALGSVASADEKAHVITGRVVELNDIGITVQSAKERLDINTDLHTVKYIGVRPKLGDTVTVHYKPFHKPGEYHARYDPDYEATKIEVLAGGGSKK